LHRPLDAKAEQLAIQVDLPVRAEPALDELLEAQQLLVSSSTLELDLDDREVARLRDDVAAGCSARCEDEKDCSQRFQVHVSASFRSGSRR
jgi:hypothetical protein